MANEIDLHVGRRLRKRRLELGLSQTELAAAAGVTFQQVQKYEVGRNRIAATRLLMMAAALGSPASAFFEGLTSSATLPPKEL